MINGVKLGTYRQKRIYSGRMGNTGMGHLLRQTSDWEDVLVGKPDWAYRPERDSKEWKTRERNEPWSVYKYNDTGVNVLALAIMNLWRKPLPLVLKEHLMDQICASDTWSRTVYENPSVIIDRQ